MAGALGNGDFTMVTVNMGKGSKKKGIVCGGKDDSNPARLSVISSLIDEHSPDIIFAQELINPKTTNFKLGLEHYESTHADAEAGLMWRRDLFEYTMIDVGMKLKITDVLKTNGKREELDFLRNRSCAIILQHKTTERKIVVISWHGPQKKKRTDVRKMDVDRKIETYKSFLDFCLLIQNKYAREMPIIIAGDFNLDLGSDKVKGAMKKSKPEDTDYTEFKVLGETEGGKRDIDFIVFLGNVEITNMHPIEYVKKGDLSILDHTPLMANVQLAPLQPEE